MCYFWMKTILHSDNGANTFNAGCLNSKIFYGNMQWYAKNFHKEHDYVTENLILHIDIISNKLALNINS